MHSLLLFFSFGLTDHISEISAIGSKSNCIDNSTSSRLSLLRPRYALFFTYFRPCNIMEELLHGSTRLPNLQYLPWHHKTVSWTAKHAHHYQSLCHHKGSHRCIGKPWKCTIYTKTTKWHYLLLSSVYKRITVSRLRQKIQNTTRTTCRKSPRSVGFIRGLASAHAHYAWMLINWNVPKGCGRRTRNRSTT